MSHVEDHIARTRARPLGTRQAAILAYARMRVAGGQSFPTVEQIAAFLKWVHGPRNIEDSLLGLEARGLIASTTREKRKRGTFPAGWIITEAGWAV